MSASFGIFDVNKVVVSAHSIEWGCDGKRMHVQNLHLFNEEGDRIGDITLFLDHPSAAIPVGNLERLDKPDEV